MWWPLVVSKKGNSRRKRKRLRSPPPAVNIPRLQRLKKKCSSSGVWSSAPESFQIFYRMWSPDDMKAFSLRIPSDVLKPFSEVDVSCYHAHHSYHVSGSGSLSRLNLYPDDLSATLFFPDNIPLGNAAVVGSTLYAMVFGGKFSGGKLMSLNLDHPHPQPQPQPQPWKQIPSPPYLEEGHPNRMPKLVSLRGRLYFFGGYIKPFGQVYDPQSETWSMLPEPPGIVDSSKCSVAFRTSLGESQGKILVYGLDDATELKTTRFHCYDVDCDQWTSCSSTWQLDVSPPLDFFMLGKAVVKEEEESDTPSSSFLYWMDKRGLVNAFDWQNMELFQGPVIGMESEGLLDVLKCDSSSFNFFHIWGDLFCLLWSSLSVPEQGGQYSSHHFTFLRLIKNSKPGYASVTAYVVGCLQDTVDGYCRCYDPLVV